MRCRLSCSVALRTATSGSRIADDHSDPSANLGPQDLLRAGGQIGLSVKLSGER